MKTFNNIMIIFFSTSGLIALYGVLFVGAYQHIAIAIICLAMVSVSLADNKREDKEKSDNIKKTKA